ncbi:acetate--CoA ligase family protein [Pseudonocardia ailaonensis]|uniref:Acetate--CoA ligase family protein n=1 Tax=Pseudonocardia ailaonensis TaxID=367279 RepID=A0ABN2N4H1_9PSEU
MLASSVTSLLSPASVVIVGASTSGDKPGTRLVRALAGRFAGPLYGVNPRRLDVPGVEWAATIEDLPVVPELACVAVAADEAVRAVEALGKLGTRAAVVYSSGFSEAGEEGTARERTLREVADRYGMAICGPNTAGLLNIGNGLVGTFTHALETGEPSPGNVAVVTQSGAVGGMILSHLVERRVGIRYWLSVGNGAVLDVADYLDALAEDPDTHVIGMFVEGIRDGRGFLRAADRCRAAGKRLILFKAGRTEDGARSAASHTGQLAGSSEVYDGVLRQHGVTVCRTVRDLLDALTLAATGAAMGEGRALVLSVSGAGCTVLADEVSGSRLTLASLAQSTTSAISEQLPGFSQTGNPVDLTGSVLMDLSRLDAVIRAGESDEGVDLIVITFATNNTTEIADAVAAAWRRTKPLLVVLPVAPTLAQPMREALRAGGVPVFEDMADAVRAADALFATRRNESRDADVARTRTGAVENGRWAGGQEALAQLGSAGLPTVVSERFASAAGAGEFALARPGNYVVKVDHPAILHKSDIGGVRVGVASADVTTVCLQIRDSARAVVADFDDEGGFVVQEIAESGAEVLVGVTQDPTFGSVLTVGVGGTLTELMGDVAFAAMPATSADIRDMIDSTRLGAYLSDYRGGSRDRDAVESLIADFQRYALAESIDEAELNPVIVRAAGAGCVVVDARMLLPESEPIQPALSVR